MSKKTLLLIFSAIIIFPSAVLAQLHSYGPSYSLSGLIPNIEEAAGLIFGAIAVICFVIAGVLFLTSRGDAEKLKAARSSVIWGFAGVIVGIIAFSIIGIVANFIR